MPAGKTLYHFIIFFFTEFALEMRELQKVYFINFCKVNWHITISFLLSR